MALADITLNDGQGTPVAHVFSFVSNVNNRVIRSDLAKSAETPLTLTMAHSDSKKAGVTTKSHLFRIDVTLLDSDGVTPYTANIRVMADVPARIMSDSLADDLSAFVRNYFSSANCRVWLKGSVG